MEIPKFFVEFHSGLKAFFVDNSEDSWLADSVFLWFVCPISVWSVDQFDFTFEDGAEDFFDVPGMIMLSMDTRG